MIPISPKHSPSAHLEAPQPPPGSQYRRRSSFDWNSARPTNVVWSILARTLVASIVRPREGGTVVVDAKRSVDEVVHVLSQKKILSAPLLNERKECVGFVDMLDILHYVVDVAPDIMDGIPTNDLKSTLVGTLIKDNREGHMFVAVPATAHVNQLIKAFANDIHRVAVIDGEQNVVSTVSQSDVTRFIAMFFRGTPSGGAVVSGDEANVLRELGSKTLIELGYKQSVHQLVTIEEKAPVLRALQLLQQRHVNSVALVDVKGVLSGNFSASDLRGLYTDHFPHFLHGIKEFLVRHSPRSIQNILVAEATSTLRELVERMVDNRVHHLWVVNGDHRPIGIICLTDIMKIVGSV